MDSKPATARISAGGVVYRVEHITGTHPRVQIALILVGPHQRWQLPKGTVDKYESNEQAALREVREETGLQAELVQQLDKIDYWFYAGSGAKRARFHKFVYFYLMRYQSGSVQDHDHEVDEALELLAFDSEKEIVRKAQVRIEKEL